jgi:hypothetical protein
VWFGIPDPASGRWQNQTRGAIKVQSYVLSNWFPRRSAYFPWRPRFPEFLINTLFFAAIVWLLRMTPPALRWHWRRKHGRCTRCGYDLRGAGRAPQASICPECGAAGSLSLGRETAGEERRPI